MENLFVIFESCPHLEKELVNLVVELYMFRFAMRDFGIVTPQLLESHQYEFEKA